MHESESELSSDTEFADALILEFPGFRTKRDHCLSHQTVVFFIIVAIIALAQLKFTRGKEVES